MGWYEEQFGIDENSCVPPIPNYSLPSNSKLKKSLCTLFVYVSLDYENIAKLLIQSGSNVNAIMNEGRIPLHEAAWHGKSIN